MSEHVTIPEWYMELCVFINMHGQAKFEQAVVEDLFDTNQIAVQLSELEIVNELPHWGIITKCILN